MDRPSSWWPDPVYSNFDEGLETVVQDVLVANPHLYAQHSAWNFCGYVWHADGMWYEDVWQYGFQIEQFKGFDLEELIEAVNEKYGYD